MKIASFLNFVFGTSKKKIIVLNNVYKKPKTLYEEQSIFWSL